MYRVDVTIVRPLSKIIVSRRIGEKYYSAVHSLRRIISRMIERLAISVTDYVTFDGVIRSQFVKNLYLRRTIEVTREITPSNVQGVPKLSAFPAMN